MVHDDADVTEVFVSTLPARRIDRRLAVAVVAVSALIFVATAPFARVQLPAVWAFIPSYQSAFAVNDLITAVLLFVQFAALRSRALLWLAAGYLFTAAMAIVHALSFPGLFAPNGLLHAGPQTTAWLYMFWHGGFPLVVIAYAALSKRDSGLNRLRGTVPAAVVQSLLAVAIAVGGLTLLATVGHDALPAFMRGNSYSPAQIAVVGSVWALSAAALLMLWFKRPHSVLDVWLMVVMCAWLFDIALAALLNAGRFDLGFYVGRIYGLAAATFVLVVLLLETGALYAQLVRARAAERKQAAAEISDINAKLKTLVESSPLPIFSLDPGGRIDTWNAAAELTFGYARAQATARDFTALPEHAPSEYRALHAQVMAGERLRNHQMRWQRGDRETLEIAYSGAPFRDSRGRIAGAVYVAEDVTEKKKLEQQLVQAQKMEAVGQLTGGIAHDFNNMLTAILLNADVLSDQIQNESLRRLAEAMRHAAEHGADLTRRLLAFGRRQTLMPQPTDVNALLAELEPLLQRTLGAHIEIKLARANDLLPATVDRAQLENAVLNLAVNARDAMPAGGRLAIETANAELDEDYAAHHPDARAGSYVMIAVSDSGVGMPAEVIARAFEPFFTTKEVGKGTGLGLSMVYGFVKQSGGHVRIYSELGAGTVVKLFLPQSKELALPAQPAPAAAELPTGTETILLVEDDGLVRAYAAAQLGALGYRMVIAENAQRAIAAVEGGCAPDLLFTDMIMPGGMNGRELAERLRRLRPALKVLYTSGYMHGAVDGTRESAAQIGHLLGKPYRRRDLAAKVRGILDERPAAA
jgi:PAS domain S-box-containing protein